MVSVNQHLQTSAIGGHVTLEPPLLAQNAIEQPVIYMGWDAVDFIVGSHDTGDVSFLDRGLERHEKGLAQDSFRVVGGRRVASTLRLAVCGKMFGCGQHVMTVDHKRCSLQSPDGGNAHAGDQERILAIGLLCAAPARITRQVQNRGEGLPDSGGRHFVGRGGEDTLDELRIPRDRKSTRLNSSHSQISYAVFCLKKKKKKK